LNNLAYYKTSIKITYMKRTYVKNLGRPICAYPQNILLRKGGGDNGDPAPEPEGPEDGAPEPSYPNDDRK